MEKKYTELEKKYTDSLDAQAKAEEDLEAKSKDLASFKKRSEKNTMQLEYKLSKP